MQGASCFAFLCCLSFAFVNVAADEPRPNLTEWKDQQAAAAADKKAVEDKQSKMGAVDKAIAMLEDLLAQVQTDGEEEAATYNKFACFCKDSTKEKLEAIQKGEDESEDLTADINSLAGRRNGMDIKIGELEVQIKGWEKDIKTATEQRARTKKLYDSNAADLAAALEALLGAIESLKTSKTPSLAQVKSVSNTIRSATMLADALGLGGSATQKISAMFLQEEPTEPSNGNAVPMEDYKFHSNDIVTTLEKLLDSFRSEKNEVDEAEVASVKEFDSTIQALEHDIKVANEELEKTQKKKQDTIDKLQSTSQALSTVSATLLEDKEYADKLSQMCTNKAKTWDQRTRARADELATLNEAIGIVKGAVAGNTTANTIRFAQTGVNLRLVKAVAEDNNAMQSIEAATEAAESEGDAAAPVFVQIARRLRGSGDKDGRETVLAFLRGEGQHLKSTLLLSLASKLAGDPLAKVKTLIQELVERLLQEASNEANQKGWCDKALSDARQKRDYAAEEIRELNGNMAFLEARRDTLTEELSELSNEINRVTKERREFNGNAEEESAEMSQTIKDARQGLNALNMCITLLDRKYKTLAKESVDLSFAQGPADDAPDAGFANGEAYTGAQSESGGILGMLDVMKSDFQRTISETEKAKAQLEADALEYNTKAGESLAEMNAASDAKTTQKSDAVGKLSEAQENLDDETTILKETIGELFELQKTCIDTGMSYEERVGRREQEIQSLNKALCILDRYAEYGPEGASEGC